MYISAPAERLPNWYSEGHVNFQTVLLEDAVTEFWVALIAFLYSRLEAFWGLHFDL